jgi:hypothetical protein
VVVIVVVVVIVEAVCNKNTANGNRSIISERLRWGDGLERRRTVYERKK